jgi:hypothetical protein
MLKLQNPPKRTIKALKDYLKGAEPQTVDNDDGDPPQFRATSAASKLFDDEEDLFSLHPAGDDDLGTKIVASLFPWLLQVTHPLKMSGNHS